jgi:hypothetical protein
MHHILFCLEKQLGHFFLPFFLLVYIPRGRSTKCRPKLYPSGRGYPKLSFYVVSRVPCSLLFNFIITLPWAWGIYMAVDFLFSSQRLFSFSQHHLKVPKREKHTKTKNPSCIFFFSFLICVFCVNFLALWICFQPGSPPLGLQPILHLIPISMLVNLSVGLHVFHSDGHSLSLWVICKEIPLSPQALETDWVENRLLLDKKKSTAFSLSHWLMVQV